MRIDGTQFEQVAELFYEAAALPKHWPVALDRLANSFGAIGAVMIAVQVGRSSVISSPSIQGVVQDFLASRWCPDNPFMRRGLELTRAGRKGLISSAEMLTPEEMARDPFVNEWRKKVGFGAEAGMLLVDHPPDLVVPITITQHPADEPYEPAELAKMNELLSTLRSAVSLALRMGFSTARVLADSMSQLGKAAVLLSESGRVLDAPATLEAQYGDAIYMHDRMVCAWDRVANERLSSAVKRAVTRAPAPERAVRCLALPRKCGGLPLVCQIVPFVGMAQDVFMLARAVLLISDPLARLDQSAAPLQESFGLTRAEARMATRIAAGQQLTEIAEAERITPETARSRLKLIFAKTGTHRQTELALLISGFRR